MSGLKLTDSLGRVHDYLRISLTEKCNLRCMYCMPAEGIPLKPASHLMTSDELLDIAGQFVDLGVNKIRLTGGEPLVRKDAGEIINRLSRLPVKLAITTNAVLVDRYIGVFEEAGIRSVNVSLDTLDATQFREITRRDEFAKVMANIRLMMEKGFKVKVNIVLMKGVNDNEIHDFIEWTRSTPVHVRFIEFMPFDGNSWEWDRIISHREVIDQLSASYELLKLQDKPHATTKGYRVKGYDGTFAVISSMTENFCGSCNRLRLTADGKLKNCLFSNEETDLLTSFRAGQDLEPLVRASLDRKFARHGGIKDLESLSPDDPDYSQRSMILIGG